MEPDRNHPGEATDATSSPYSVPPIAGLPFAEDSEEARAIEAVIEEADREHAKASEEATST